MVRTATAGTSQAYRPSSQSGRPMSGVPSLSASGFLSAWWHITMLYFSVLGVIVGQLVEDSSTEGVKSTRGYSPPFPSPFFFASTDQIFSFSKHSLPFPFLSTAKQFLHQIFPSFSLSSADQIFSLFKYFPSPFFFPFANQIFSSFSLTKEESSLTRSTCHFGYTENGEEKLRKHQHISWGGIQGYLGITLRK